MENSAFEAMYTGVYIFVFIAALTMTLYMFKNVNEVSENSYEYGMNTTSQSLIDESSEKDRILNANDVISYYYNYVDYDITDFKNVHVEIKDRNGAILSSGISYNDLKSRLGTENYRLKCVRVNSYGEYYFEIYKV